ncbi:hypothetical protein J2Z21_003676 [Streptomyces griseochromogenes]|uniref:Uncharacterized protein n=1 Tax=Streptomyces griseochromogenes TaxID=68214 RepID=A0A1B1AP40_9ACTN|nr:hypothetical protein [Streptomyces griseochromogenes]ANP48332.1 hypothetical protein AVL59_00955 [Streptomyces griseochromogenes]MBP2050726.1 hypothetical protein [Streptomyces griseochromogenes]
MMTVYGRGMTGRPFHTGGTHMDSTGAPMDARQAKDALTAAQAAQAAARTASDRRTKPRGWAVGQALTFAAGFTALGLAENDRQWATWLTTGAVLSIGAFFTLIWLGAHHGGVTRWFTPSRETGRWGWRAWLPVTVAIAVSMLAAIPYGTTGWMVAFGLAGGLEHLLRATGVTSA